MIELIIEGFFYWVCGWVGHVFVKVITFGKVDLEWGSSSESVITETIGMCALLFIGLGISWAWQ